MGKKISEELPTPTKEFTSYLVNQKNPGKCFKFQQVTTKQVKDIIENMKSKSSQGPDGISTKVLKALAPSITEPLAHLINKSLDAGEVPQCFKIAKVCPIFKSGDAELFSNHRPISLLPSMSKILEKVVSRQITKYLAVNEILYQNQFGFRKQHQTQHAVIKLLNTVLGAKKYKENSLAVFCDLKKCFDVVDRKILLSKLQHYQILGKEHDWFKSYLENRVQFVQYNNYTSDTLPIDYGVVQGSTLGPILFNIMINDIQHAVNEKEMQAVLFADDTTLHVHDKDINTLKTKGNKQLENISDWFIANRLALHPAKTKYMFFHPNESKIKHDLPWKQIHNDVHSTHVKGIVLSFCKARNRCE